MVTLPIRHNANDSALYRHQSIAQEYTDIQCDVMSQPVTPQRMNRTFFFTNRELTKQ